MTGTVMPRCVCWSEGPEAAVDAEEIDLAGGATAGLVDLAAELEDGCGGVAEVGSELRAEEVFAAGEDLLGLAGTLFGNLEERGFDRVAGEERA